MGADSGAWATAGDPTGAGVAAAAVLEATVGGALPCAARHAREVGAFGAAVGSTGFVTLRVIRAMAIWGRGQRRPDHIIAGRSALQSSDDTMADGARPEEAMT